MSESTSIILTDYQQLYHEARMRFLSSNDWERKRNSFLRELHQKVVVGDNEELKRYLRNKREDELNEFNKAWISKIWEKCFDAEKSEFNVISFFRKLAMVNDGQIDVEDLRAFFIYKCTTENIDNLLRLVLEYDTRSRATINAQNIIVVNGEVVIKKEETSDPSGDAPTEHLDNIIFRTNLFDSDARLTSLRNTIASFINLGEDNNKLSVAAENQIEPTAQNEWYYILIAIGEAEIAGRNVFTDVNFAKQMISWFPWLFHFDTPEEMAAFKRKFTKSISAERSLWKYGAKKEVTAIKDMWARQRTLGIDYAKLSRLHPVANGLKKALEELKTEIQKAQNAKR